MIGAVYQRPWLYGAQSAALFCPERYGVIEASTKAGKTHASLVWLYEQAVVGGRRGRNYWWVAPVRTQARIALVRLLRWLPTGTYKVNWSDYYVTLYNGAEIWFKGSDRPDSLYGEDVYAAVVDEGSRCKEEAWVALRSTLTATRGPVRVIGNVRGTKNWAYKLGQRARAGAEGFHFARITAWDAVEAGIIAREEVEDAKRVLPDDVFRELYECVASADGANPFGMAHIRACMALQCRAGGTAHHHGTGGPVAYWGVDLARAVDWTVAVGLDATGRTAAFYRWHGPWTLQLQKLRALIGQTPAVMDATGVGDPIVPFLQAADSTTPAGRMPPIATTEDDELEWASPREAGRIMRERAKERAAHPEPDSDLLSLRQGCTNLVGYTFTAASKQRLMESYAVSVQQHAIGLVTGSAEQDSGPVLDEHESFEYEYTRTGVRYSAPAGLHDDTVAAYALADWCRRESARWQTVGGAAVAV